MRILFLTLSIILLTACGASFQRKPAKTTTGLVQGGGTDLCPVSMSYVMTANGIGVCTAPAASCTTGSLCSAQPMTPCPAGLPAGTVCTIPLTQVTTPIASVGAVTANADVPDSYTFLDTPNANLCLDAFIRAGTPVPANAVARTLTVNTNGSNSLVSDINPTSVPVVTIITARQCGSNVMLQLLNPAGFYCIVGIDSWGSNVTIQKSCSAQMASLEPQTINNGSASRGGFHLWWFGQRQQPSDGAFFGSYNQRGSSIKEVPCIP